MKFKQIKYNIDNVMTERYNIKQFGFFIYWKYKMVYYTTASILLL